MKKILRIVGIVILVGIFGGTIYFLYTKSKKAPEVFETKNPFVSNVVRKTVATGSVVPRREIEIVPQVSGIIDELYLSLIHISEPTRRTPISYAVFCLK